MIIAALLGLAALLYSSVGHGGASAYLAVMALMNVSPAVMRPTALVLNLVVATLTTITFARAGHFRWPLVWPFLLTSVPMAWLGGRIALPSDTYRIIVGVVLLASAARLVVTVRAPDTARRTPPLSIALIVGAALGFLAGLTGVGGGIFLSPVLLLAGWATLRTTAATSAVFILANSAAGLLGHLPRADHRPADLAWWVAAVVIGGVVGSQLGARRLPSPALRTLLATVLLVAGIKLLLG